MASPRWKLQLQKASFRGIPFFFQNAEAVIGRRNVLHEYPLRDTAYSEDLGKKAREFSFNAYTIGDDCIDDLKNLVRAIEENQDPGILVHPVLGIMSVVPRECRVIHNNTDGGIEYLQLTFAEAGVNKYPSATIDTQKNVRDKAQVSLDQIKASFAENYQIEGFPDALATRAINTLIGATSIQGGNLIFESDSLYGNLNRVLNKSIIVDENKENYAAYKKKLEDFKDDVPNIIDDPDAVADSITDVVTDLDTVFLDKEKLLKQYIALYKQFGTYFTPLPVTSSSTPSQVQESTNQGQILDIVAINVFIQVALSLSNIDFDSREEAFATLFDIEALIEPKLTYLADAGFDDAYNALNNARVAMVLDIKARASTFKTVKHIKNYETLPALVLAYQSYQDASQDQDIIDRNKVRHPLFVPANKDIEILV